MKAPDSRRAGAGLHVSHDPVRHCFECSVDGQRCVAEYRLERRSAPAPGSDVMAMTHTFVPAALEGRGIAAALVATALAHARAQRLKVSPQCTYVRSYMQRHPDTLDLLA